MFRKRSFRILFSIIAGGILAESIRINSGVDINAISLIVVINLMSLGLAIYCQLEIVPNYEFFDRKIDLQQFERDLWRSYADQKFLYGSIALFLGPIATILGLIVGLKKYKIGWIALGLGLVAFVLGAIQSTHMFS